MAEKLDANGEPVREKVGGLTDRIFVKLSGGTATSAPYFEVTEPQTYADIQAF